MKRFIVFLVGMLLLVCIGVSFPGCSKHPTDAEIRQIAEQTLPEPWQLIDSHSYDGKTFQKVYFNTETKITYVYNYFWRSEYHSYTVWVVEKVVVTIYDENGLRIDSFEE